MANDGDKAINMNDQSKVKNLCDWPISWQRYTKPGDEYLKPNSSVYISNTEIDSQINNGNRFFTGTDGLGSHAEVYIENADLRELFNFDHKEDKREQLIINEEKCKSILELKTLSAFKKNVDENIVTNQERRKLIETARKMKFNDHEKISFIEQFCGMEF